MDPVIEITSTTTELDNNNTTVHTYAGIVVLSYCPSEIIVVVLLFQIKLKCFPYMREIFLIRCKYNKLCNYF